MYLLGTQEIIQSFFAHLPISSMPATVPQLALLHSVLSIHLEITELLSFEECVKFIELVQNLKPTITLSLLPDEPGPWQCLHRPIHIFLTKAL